MAVAVTPLAVVVRVMGCPLAICDASMPHTHIVPLLCHEQETASAGGGAARVIEREVVVVAPAESVTDTLTLCVPAVVGVPEMVPPVLKPSPAGRPVADHV